MIKKSFQQFKKQFTKNSYQTMDIPYNIPITDLIIDSTTSDDFDLYFKPSIKYTDGGVTFCYTQDEYKLDYTSAVDTTITTDTYYDYNLSNIATINSHFTSLKPYCITIKLPLNDSTVIFTTPFNDSTAYFAELLSLDFNKRINYQYSSFNEHLIYPVQYLDYYSDVLTFAKDLYKISYDLTNIHVYNTSQNVMLFSPLFFPLINKNLKYHMTLDQSFVGAKILNEFNYTPVTRTTNKSTNITQDLLNIVYEHETDLKINGFVLLDTNITEYMGNNNFHSDITTIIENENYYINRQLVPPSRYMSKGDSYIHSTTYNTVLNFTTYDNIRHVKIKQHNHTQSKYNNNINESKKMLNTALNEFLVEFSGYNEVIEL